MNAKLLLISALFASPFIVTGFCFIFLTLRARAWPSTAGRILEAKSGFTMSYDFKARYCYCVHGQNFESSRVTVADWFYSCGVIAVRRFEKRFPVGRDVAVYYDPANPKRSVLYRPGFASAIFLLACGFATFAVLLKFSPSYRFQ